MSPRPLRLVLALLVSVSFIPAASAVDWDLHALSNGIRPGEGYDIEIGPDGRAMVAIGRDNLDFESFVGPERPRLGAPRVLQWLPGP